MKSRFEVCGRAALPGLENPERMTPKIAANSAAQTAFVSKESDETDGCRTTGPSADATLAM